MLEWVLVPPQVPLLLYQRIGLCVGVAALFKMSSRVQQGLLGGAELGGLGQLRALSVGERGCRTRLPLGYWVPAGLRGLCGCWGCHARWPLQWATFLGLKTSLTHGCSLPTSCPPGCAWARHASVQQEVHAQVWRKMNQLTSCRTNTDQS